jgi:ribosomal protein S18 acetylase RimI-like enzyme
MLAVSPTHQGRGIAKELLQAAHATLAADSDNKQVYLYTTAAGSRKFYEKQGYRLVAATQAAGADVYHMVYTLPAP